MLNKEILTATLFLAPFVLNEYELGITRLKDCIGVFYKDTNKPEWENKIFIAFKNSPVESIYLANKVFNGNKYAYTKYTESLDNDTYVIYVYNIPPNLKIDIERLSNGEYTKLSDTAKNIILNSTRVAWMKDFYESYFTKRAGMKFTTFHEAGILNLNKVPIKKGESDDSPFYFMFPDKNCLALYVKIF
jgi:hypothetical protein